MKNLGWVTVITCIVVALLLATTTTAEAKTVSPHILTATTLCHKQGPPKYVCNGIARATFRAKVPLRWASNPYLIKLLWRESSWNVCSINPSKRNCAYTGSRACGLFQFLPCRCFYPGYLVEAKAFLQSICGFRYVKNRYGTPRKALNFHTQNGWY